MFETIIIPLDGSSTAEITLPYAAEISARLKAELVLLFVKTPNDVRSENLLRIYAESLVTKAQQIAAQFQNGDGPIKTRIEIITGNPADETINFAEKQPGPHIMMATHGQSGHDTRWALGSVVDKVVRATQAPISIIRVSRSEPEVHGPIHVNRVLVPLDGSSRAECVLPFVKELALRLKSEVTFMEVIKLEYLVHNMVVLKIREDTYQRVKEYMEEQVNDFTAKGITAKYEIIETVGSIGETINRYTQKNAVDTVIMATHGMSRPHRILFGSVTTEVMMEGNTPLMLIRTPC